MIIFFKASNEFINISTNTLSNKHKHVVIGNTQIKIHEITYEYIHI